MKNPIQGIPYVTLGLIGLNIVIYLYQMFLSRDGEMLFLYQYGAVPALITGQVATPEVLAWPPRAFTLVSSMFLHGGLFHLAGNMLYLWIFGNNIEDAMGPARFVLFYLLGGVISGLAHCDQRARLPAAHGGGIRGHRRGAGRLLPALPPGPGGGGCCGSFSTCSSSGCPPYWCWASGFCCRCWGKGGPGVAWMAHIGGFVVGLVLVRLFVPRPRPLT